MTAVSESEGVVVDLPSHPSPSKSSKTKGKKKEPNTRTGASVDELWTSSAPSHVFPEEWVGAARSKLSDFSLMPLILTP